jgi:hypothetical protein
MTRQHVLAQIRAIFRLELKKNLLSRRGWWVYLLGLMPVLLTGLHALLSSRGVTHCSIGEDTLIFAGIFQLFYIRFAIFFGTVGIFSSLFRGDVLDKSLHYYFLAPVRRDVLMAGKYLVGLVTSTAIFLVSMTLSFVFMYLHFRWEIASEYLFAGPGMGQLGWYVLTTILACAGYGAVFVALGLRYSNPMIPAGVVLLWEGLNPVLPETLKKISVLFYLKSLCPVQLPARGPLALITVGADWTPAWIAIPGLLCLVVGLLFLASRQIARMEISYSAE